MAYRNLNSIVRGYIVQNISELKKLKKELRNVPVSIKNFKVPWFKYEVPFLELSSLAELSNPEGIRPSILDSCDLPYEEILKIYERRETPYPILFFNGENFNGKGDEQKFAERCGLDEVVLPHKNSKVPTKIIKHVSLNAIAILFEEGKRLRYLELYLSDTFP